MFVLSAGLIILLAQVSAATDYTDLLSMTSAVRAVAGALDTVILLDADNDAAIGSIGEIIGGPMATVLLVGAEDNNSKVVRHLNYLKAQDRLDMVAMPGFNGHVSFVRALDAELKLAQSKIISLLPWAEEDRRWPIELRLDSMALFYKEVQEGYDIVEEYTVKKGPVISQTLGRWNSTGAKLSVLPGASHVWERRSDLAGIELRNGVLEWRILMEFVRDPKGNIVGTTGPMAFTMDFLAAALNVTVKLVIPEDGMWGGLSRNAYSMKSSLNMGLHDC